MSPSILIIAKDYELLVDSLMCHIGLDQSLIVKIRPAIHPTVTNHYQELIRKNYVKRLSIVGGEFLSIALDSGYEVQLK
jgi:hypothetical protein